MINISFKVASPQAFAGIEKRGLKTFVLMSRRHSGPQCNLIQGSAFTHHKEELTNSGGYFDK
nr:hypothetical protein [Candidatus Brachybacter algidus]